ncbi:MAG: peptidylprolyl isomerase [Acetobacter sp.]|nr:peptidylprolyl isomerase [Bacteroides sp.]MCM1340653.1 peptidylprolyl isomerase [Acetobacter sp.]MCM1433764.1 peptidylprolyl isomerase [Clostridiales bacterium]
MDEKNLDSSLKNAENELNAENNQDVQQNNSVQKKDDFDTAISGIGVKYENNDNWQFEAEAPTIADDFLQLDGKPDVAENDTVITQNNQTVSSNEQIVIKKETLKFIPLAIFVAACIAVISVFSVRYFTVPNGKEGRYMNPGSVVATINGEKISTGMFNYYYSSVVKYYENYASYYGLDTSADYSNTYTTDEDGNQITWLEFFEKEIFDEIKYTSALYSNAVDAGITLTDKQKETIDSQIENFKTTASESNISLNEYLASTFGNYCTEDTIRLMLEQYYVTVNYKGYLSTTNIPDDKEIEKYFDEHTEDFKNINFSYLAFEYDTTDDETKAKAQKRIDGYIEKITDRESMLKLVPEVYADFIENDINSMLESDSEISKNDARKQAVANYESTLDYSTTIEESPFDEETTNWIFSDDTKIGEKKCYINTDAGYAYLILKTEEPTVDKTETYSVRHILIMPRDEDGNTDTTGEKTFTDEQWADAEKKAKEILDSYNNGEKTEYAFSLLAEKKSDDIASTSASGNSEAFGGLCESVALGSMVKPFEDWSIDKNRKYGDTDIVKSDFGYHIMFFINDYEQYKSSIIKAIKNEKLDSMVNGADEKINNKKVEKAVNAYYELRDAAAANSAASSGNIADEISADTSVDTDE